MALYRWYTFYNANHIIDTWYKCESSVPCLVAVTRRNKGNEWWEMQGNGWLTLPHAGKFLHPGPHFIPTETNNCLLRVQRWMDASWERLLMKYAYHVSQSEHTSPKMNASLSNEHISLKANESFTNEPLPKWMYRSQNECVSLRVNKFLTNERISLRVTTSLSRWTHLSQSERISHK